jgi:NAD(P)-dependent dehydrogenase (short-subunit alcohol dehydrogenase family)
MPSKNIIISAAADGIGWTIAKSCLEKGYSVYLSDINQQKIDEIKDHPLINNKIFIDNVDANNPDSIEKYFDSIKEKTSTIDVLINNVGIAGPTGPMESLSISDWKRTIEVNINGHFYFF